MTLILILFFGGLIVSFIISRTLKIIILKSFPLIEKGSPWLKKCVFLGQFIVFLLIFVSFAPLMEFPVYLDSFFRQVLKILMALSMGLLAACSILVFQEVLVRKYSVQEKDNLKARKIHTQFQLFKKIIFLIIGIITFIAVMMSFEAFRRIGTALIASAGVAGLVIGLAAQKTLAAVLSGLQLAITQPVRIDDVVIVEGEWGKIEELTLTYVVVRTWDLRRLIVPTTYFLEKPFQNWTRVSSDLLGTVFIYTDYNISVDLIREEIKGILIEDPRWDGKVSGVQVTDSSKGQMELRILISASNAGDAWDLRCAVRERVLSFIRQKYPEALPRTRVQVEPGHGLKQNYQDSC
ncbi:MAG: mechanosensitive ion channel [Synergistales bacterium]|nr:mechanosensitive ion channel [Synergistales bacterium]